MADYPGSNAESNLAGLYKDADAPNIVKAIPGFTDGKKKKRRFKKAAKIVGDPNNNG
jgi:hypothetical protein